MLRFTALLRPGQGFKPFSVLRETEEVSDSGWACKVSRETAGTIHGIISQANQTEKEQWKQSGHPITHTVVQVGNANRAKATDVLFLEAENRRFLVQGVQDPAELGHYTVYHVEERADLQ